MSGFPNTQAAINAAIAATVTPPKLILPPGTVANGAATVAVWPAVNRAIFMRLVLPVKGIYRYLRIREGVASGNVQFAVSLLSGVGLTTLTLVLDSGVIAAPVAGDLRYDFGPKTLVPGDYAISVWADNTTVSFAHSTTATGFPAVGQTSEINSLATGVTNATVPVWGNSFRYITVALEADD